MQNRNQILKKYNVSPDALIGRGMEAEVFSYGKDAVLKLYAGTASFDDLVTLKSFYDSLDRKAVNFHLPHIESVTKEDDFVVTIEKKLTGVPTTSFLDRSNSQELDAIMREYASAVVTLAELNSPAGINRYKLFDPDGFSQTDNGDWNQFLLTFINHKLVDLTPFLERDVENFAEKLERLNSILRAPYSGETSIIHGDFCPENLLLNDQHQATAVIDFGLFTMMGDPLFDVATSWVFFDMYDELKANIRERLLAIMLEALGEAKRGLLYRYVLVYSILSANAYSADCTDGHYHWCVANLNNQKLWDYVR